MFALQPLDVVLSQDRNQIVCLLEYVRYDFLPQIQQSSIKIMSILRLALSDNISLISLSDSLEFDFNFNSTLGEVLAWLGWFSYC